MNEIRRRDAETAGSTSCGCYVNTAEIKQGAWQKDPSQCLRNCKVQFLRSVSNGWGESEGWADGCGHLNRGVALQEFWPLYWCDSTFCGVGIDRGGGLGQDPTVDLIINTCQNIGFYSIHDPGPPPPDFKCRTEADTQEGCSVSVMPVPQSSTASPSSVGTAPPISTTTHTKPTPSVVISVPTAAPPAATESTAPTAASTASESSLTGQGKAAIAICSVLALVLVICFVLIWLRRRNRCKASFRHALRFRHGLSHGHPPAGSPTPLISPTSSAIGARTMLTPPLRLRDRKFLPSILRSGSRSPSPPLTPLTPAYSPQPGGRGAFPSSPICSPTINKLIPRHERSYTTAAAATPRTYTGYPPLIASLTPESTFSLPIPVPGGGGGRVNSWTQPPNNNSSHRGSASAASSCYTGTGGAITTSSSTTTAHSSLRHEIPIAAPPYSFASGGGSSSGREATPPPPPLVPAPPSSPSPCRPPRPHEAMLQIPDLVTPATTTTTSLGSGRGGVDTPPPPPLSPPPTKALPRTPSLVPLPLRGSSAPDAGSPPPAVLGGGGGGPPPPPEQAVSAAAGAGQPGSRGSWGSWSGTGTVVGGGSDHHASSSTTAIGGAAEIEAAGGESGGKTGAPVSPRTSEGSGVTATGESVVSAAVSRMSSMREDDAGGKI
ncbi:hypothetical protein C8A00DRAFT_39959 [Chaetomidium leptoderma]|uniref:Uncharacterized protein n=1 Tax=Chaetomidium leptoderma TaxID=669021 RepID=A0AAN6VTT9_9PEZI|nr:hypothetical protein C8A00DRAFT_39959 [Chaetomidium leptoderma]